MALFSKNMKLRQVEFPVTVVDGDDNNPPVVVECCAVSERKYDEMSNDWLVRDRKDFMNIKADPRKIGEHFAEFIVLFEGDRVQMSGLTLGNLCRLAGQVELDEEDQARFRQADPTLGVRLTKAELIGFCSWYPQTFGYPLNARYRDTFAEYGKKRAIEEEANRKNSLNGAVAALESAS